MSQPFVPKEGETLLWQGRPAPRCFVFQHARQALIGLLLFLLSSFWLMLAWELTKAGSPAWIMALPLPILLGSFWFGPWQLVRARLHWPHIFYTLTDRRLYSSLGVELPLSEIRRLRLRKHSPQLNSFRVETDQGATLVLSCIENPQTFKDLLNETCPQIDI